MSKNPNNSQPVTDIGTVKKLYDAIVSREISCLAAIEFLERVTGYDFKNTKDFKNKMGQFIEKHHYNGEDLKKTRNWSGHTQTELAELFGVPITVIKQIESGKKPISQDAIDFIKVMGIKKTVPIKKARKFVPVDKEPEKKIKPAYMHCENKEEWELWWWEALNPWCLECQKDCKQSAKVELGHCPQFRKIEKSKPGKDKAIMAKTGKALNFQTNFQVVENKRVTEGVK